MGALASNQSVEPRRDVIVSRNPATGEVLGEVPIHSAGEVRAAVARAREAQRGWAALPVRERGLRVLGFRDALRAEAE